MDNLNTALESREQNKATARILTVLSAFASNIGEFGISELSQHLGMTKNMVFRAMQTLVEQDYIVRDPSGQRYQLGVRVLELQNNFAPEPTFRTLCAPYIQQLHELTGETVSLMVQALDYCVFIDGIETRKPGVWRLPIGGLRTLHGFASGHMILASWEDTAIAAYIARQQREIVAGAPKLDPDALWRDIRLIRAQGYASLLRDAALPMLSVAFPVWDAENRLHGVMSVGGPQERFAPVLAALLPRLIAIVDSLSQRTRLYSANAPGAELTL